jgi:hypothetical protein
MNTTDAAAAAVGNTNVVCKGQSTPRSAAKHNRLTTTCARVATAAAAVAVWFEWISEEVCWSISAGCSEDFRDAAEAEAARCKVRRRREDREDRVVRDGRLSMSLMSVRSDVDECVSSSAAGDPSIDDRMSVGNYR